MMAGLRDSVRPDLQNTKVRVQQTADERHSEQAEKKRKVDPKELEHLGEHLRYRFLGLRLSLAEVKKYFDRKKMDSNPENPAFILGEQSNKIPSPPQLPLDDEPEW